MIRIHVVGRGDTPLVLAAADLFDHPPTVAWTDTFIASPIHHLLLAFDDDASPGVAVGFVSGVETTHPDKGTEMFLYELAVAEPHRRRGIATALVDALGAVAREHGCYGMWVATEPDNAAALATYAGAGALPTEPAVILAWTFTAPEPTNEAPGG
ncbi:MAG: GCN5-related protein N-acetyltransferase [Ilumatobacteraceae bacterium]|nr:GCN5-related protein N-acetyltransferase [Ilumatobacteraceae bacterium]